MQNLDQPVLELNPLTNIFIFFWDYPPANRVLSTRSSKSPEFYPIKNVYKKKKRYSCIFKKKRVTSHLEKEVVGWKEACEPSLVYKP
jgi:hypothetical protein